MPIISIVEKVLVMITSVIVKPSPPTWHIEYDVCNVGKSVIWLIIDESLVFRRDDRHIELSYAREKMQPGVQVFGYFNPAVANIPPDGSLRRSVEINWPCHLSDIWNIEREVSPPPGEYKVSVRIGFASTEAPQPPNVGEDVEVPVMHWQKEAVSTLVQIVIPPYD
jgi:hypothetical protein